MKGKIPFGEFLTKFLIPFEAAVFLATGIAVAADSAPQESPVVPVNVIFDTDMWADIDDAFALALLHSLQDRHEVNLLAITVSTGEGPSASYVDLLNTFYGHSNIPIGIIHNDMNLAYFRMRWPETPWPLTRYTEYLSEEKAADGSLIYPHRLTNGLEAIDATILLRKVLASQLDNSVVLIQVGYSTNLAHLLDSTADAVSSLSGLELVKRKVRLLSMMGGNFGDSIEEGKLVRAGSAEFNLEVDVPSAQKLFTHWPSPIVISGFEVGVALPYPVDSIARNFNYVSHHPLVETYRSYLADLKGKLKLPHNRPTWDLTSALYAARPDSGYFELSKPGRVKVLNDGGSRFEESAGGNQRYLILKKSERERVLEALVALSSEPPVKPQTAK